MSKMSKDKKTDPFRAVTVPAMRAQRFVHLSETQIEDAVHTASVLGKYRTALEHYVKHCARCGGTGKVVGNYDFAATPCHVCSAARDALREPK